MATNFLLSLSVSEMCTFFTNLEGVGQAHEPEICLAWMETIDGSLLCDYNTRSFRINCPVNVEIYDSENILVAAIYNDVPQEIEDSSIIAFVDENGQKIVYLPTDEEYSIKVIATDDGEVTYSVQETDGDSVKVVNYNNIAVKKNDILTGSAENLSEAETGVYSLSVNGQEKTPEIIEEATPAEISVVSEGNGNVSGGGTFYKGEYAKVIAMPAENEQFLGWYNGDTLVSEDAEHRFAVTDTAELTAKFTQNTCEVIFLDGDEIISAQRVIKGSTAEVPEAPEKIGYIFNGYFTDEELTIPFSETAVWNEDTVIYAKYDAKLSFADAELIDCLYSENNVEANIKFNYINGNCRVILAVYDENNQLKAITSATAATDDETASLSVLADESFVGCSVKVFLWNDNLKPIGKTLKGTVSSTGQNE